MKQKSIDQRRLGRSLMRHLKVSVHLSVLDWLSCSLFLFRPPKVQKRFKSNQLANSDRHCQINHCWFCYSKTQPHPLSAYYLPIIILAVYRASDSVITTFSNGSKRSMFSLTKHTGMIMITRVFAFFSVERQNMIYLKIALNDGFSMSLWIERVVWNLSIRFGKDKSRTWKIL